MDGTALVTGGSGTIGRAVVDRLAAAGLDVAVGYRSDEAGAQAAAAAARERGRTATTVGGDLTEPAAGERLVEAAAGLGPLAVVVHAAGTVDPRPVGSAGETIRETLASNVESAVHVVDPAVERLRDRGGGAVVVVSSVAALAGTVDTTYAAAKGGLVGYSRALAREVGPDGIRANAVCPGPVDGPMNDAITESLEARRFRGHATVDSLLDRYEATPAEVADAVAFLATHEFVTGEVVRVDGGLALG